MSASNYTPISLYYSTTPSQQPSGSNLIRGELALNIYDGKLYYKDTSDNVQLLASKDVSSNVTSVSLVTANGFSGTVANPSTTPAITLTTTASGILKGSSGALIAASPGVDYAPATSGTSLLYGNGSGGFSNVTIGSNLTFVGGTLSATGGAAGVSSFNSRTGVVTLASSDVTGALGYTPGTGTVTSVAATSPVSSSGGTTPTISLASGYGDTQNPYASKTANYFLAAPNGSSGAPTFRAIVAADIPTLNQNTTGSSGSCTGNAATATTASNATNLGGYSAASYPRLAASNTFTTVQVVAMPTESQGVQVSYSSYLSAVGPRAVQCGYTGQGLYSPSSGTISLSAASGGTWGLSGQDCEWTGSGNAYKIGGGSWAASSDARLKTNATPLTGALNKIASLNPVSYDWKYQTSEPTIGFIAQEVQPVFPSAVGRIKPTEEQKQFVGEDDVYSLGWQNDIFAYLVGAIKELKAEVDALKAAK